MPFLPNLYMSINFAKNLRFVHFLMKAVGTLVPTAQFVGLAYHLSSTVFLIAFD
jgi:hypothetical protein